MKIGSQLLILSFIIIAVFACNQISTPENEQSTVSTFEQGEALVQDQCMACHSAEKASLGPSWKQIQQVYKSKAEDSVAFALLIRKFLQNPAAENAMVPHAVEQYGRMAKINLTESEIAQIVAYLYGAEWGENTLSRSPDSALLQAQQIAQATQKVLGKNLMKALQSKGTVHALSFCSERAMVLTDSMAQVHGIHIQRVSDQNRNPANKANAAQLTYIQKAKALLAQGAKVKPEMNQSDSWSTAYFPILTQGMCLKCHGQANTDVKAEVMAQLKQLYPQDQAMNYKAGDLRGIWVIRQAR